MSGMPESISFPPGSLVLLSGLPGAGKSTLLDRLYGLTGAETTPVTVDGVLVIDSRQSRARWAAVFPRLPRRLRSLLVHVTHMSRISGAVLGDRPVVAHSRALWPHILYGFAWLARMNGRKLYVILLDVEPEIARAGQVTRGRIIRDVTFTRHTRRWRALIDRARTGALPPADGVVVLDRPAADQVKAIVFEWRGSPSSDVTSGTAVPS